MIDKESHTDNERCMFKNCVDVIYVTHVIWTKLILRHVSADCAYILGDYSSLKKLQCRFCCILLQTIMFYLLILSGLSDMHFYIALPSLKINNKHIM